MNVLLVMILSVFMVSIFLVGYDFLKRFLTQIKHQRLDQARAYFTKVFSEAFQSSSLNLEEFKNKLNFFSPLKKQALLEVMLEFFSKMPDKIRVLAQNFGFIKEYEDKLNSSKPYIRGEAFRILESFLSKESLAKMLEALKKEKHPEVAFVGFLSCCKLLNTIHFKTFLQLLYEKQREGVLNLRCVSLIITEFVERFKEKASFAVYDFLKEGSYSVSFRIGLLDGIYYAKHLDETLLKIVKDQLTFEDPEILAKALKVLSKIEKIALEDVLPFLKHPAWFVRLSALKVLGKNIRPEIVEYIVPLLEDENALVRKEAAKVLFKLPEEAVIINLPNFLQIKDPYGRDAVVGEMVISGFWERLKEGRFKETLKDYVEKIKSLLQLHYKLA